VKALGVLAGISLALVIQTTVTPYLPGGAAPVDLVLVAVVYVALTTGPVGGLLAGTVAGLIQDALSGGITGIIGIGGLAKSVVGFFVGAIGQQFIVTAALPRLVMFMAATALHAAVFMGLYAALDLRMFPTPWTDIGAQVIGNALVGMIAFGVIEATPGMVERRRFRRRARR
jgi:rod shape-determining protein MreD